MHRIQFRCHHFDSIPSRTESNRQIACAFTLIYALSNFQMEEEETNRGREERKRGEEERKRGKEDERERGREGEYYMPTQF